MPGIWRNKFNGDDITKQLDPTNPMTVEGKELVLNYRAPVATQRCREDQLPAAHAWFMYVSYNGQCYCLGPKVVIQRPFIELTPEPFAPGSD